MTFDIMKTVLIFMIFFAWKARSYPLIDKNTRIDDLQSNGSSSQIIYMKRVMVFKLSTLDIPLSDKNYDGYEYAIMQTHCHHQNITIRLESTANAKIIQTGTNMGFLLKSNDSQSVLKLSNKNSDDVRCLVALIAYSKTSPIPGNCITDKNSASIKMIKLIEEPKFLTAIIPRVNEASKSCKDSELTYETYYTYIDMMNFGFDVYFDGIERMLYDSITTAYKAKQVPLHNRHLLETIPGRGVIVNTVIKGKNGDVAYFVPVASYSCPQNTWSMHCTDNDFSKRGLSIVLIILCVVMILNLMSPEFIESILNGMLFGGFITILFLKSFSIEMPTFNYFMSVIFGASIVSALLGVATMYLAIGRYLSKLTLSMFLVIFTMEIFFDSITSVDLQLIIASILSIFLIFVPFTFSVILGSLILILNVSFLLKFGNLHRFAMNNYLSITTLPAESINETYFDFIRPNYINYKVYPNIFDYILLVFYIVFSIYFTIRKEKYFQGHPEVMLPDPIFTELEQARCFRGAIESMRAQELVNGCDKHTDRAHCRRHLFEKHPAFQERSPLIMHWLAGSDDEDDSIHTPPETSRNRVRIRAVNDSYDPIEVIGPRTYAD